MPQENEQGWAESLRDLKLSIGIGSSGSAYHAHIGGSFVSRELAAKNAERYLEKIAADFDDLESSLSELRRERDEANWNNDHRCYSCGQEIQPTSAPLCQSCLSLLARERLQPAWMADLEAAESKLSEAEAKAKLAGEMKEILERYKRGEYDLLDLSAAKLTQMEGLMPDAARWLERFDAIESQHRKPSNGGQ